MLGASYFGPSYFGGAFFGGVAAAVVELPGLTLTPDFGPRYTVPSPSPSMKPLALGTDDLLRFRGVKVFDPDTGSRIPATGISLQARIALTPTGAAVDASLAIDLTERAAGDFYGILHGTDLEAHLRDALGELVFVVLTIGSDYVGHYPRRVVDGVRIGA